jgi:two-component system OmpR family response regulator
LKAIFAQVLFEYRVVVRLLHKDNVMMYKCSADEVGVRNRSIEKGLKNNAIWVVDDDPRICQLLDHYLAGEGYRVRTATSAEAFFNQVVDTPADLIILDVMLPDQDGFGVTRQLRAQSEVPILMLTGRAETVDKVVGLELGADDYLTKPFERRELLARVRSLLRRAHQRMSSASINEGAVVHFAGWRLDLAGHTLLSPSGEPVELTRHEFLLLAAFVKRRQRSLTRDDILNLIAGRDWSPYDRSVDVLVGRLRAKLEQDPKHPTLILTVRGVGYKFGSPVSLGGRGRELKPFWSQGS